ncbi:exodeoxyribonuclease VII small subunit [Thalassospiraceae bacterium LMO-JJ14]|nr:exodeoxyribonuclease VII small subunit [Thalassospiraceae bacterium LMO-JJ14]
MAKDKAAEHEKIPDEIAEMSFEAALEELEGIVRELEAGEGDLDTSINGYTRGVFLKRHCEAKLKEAEARIDKIVVGTNGAVDTQPLDDA